MRSRPIQPAVLVADAEHDAPAQPIDQPAIAGLFGHIGIEQVLLGVASGSSGCSSNC